MYRLYLWHHRIVFLGVSPENDLHRHHAAQFCVSLDSTEKIRVSHADKVLDVSGIFISPDQAHRIDAGDARILSLYLEPDSTEYQPLIQPLWQKPPAALENLLPSSEGIQALQDLLAEGGDGHTAWSICVSALGLGSIAEPVCQRDARIEQVVQIIRDEPGRSHTLPHLADAVHLSPGRLTHLFREQMGIPIRRFTVWTRVRQVVRLAVDGASLTEAAHTAGFADAAHMSNSFRGMFGFSPSTLFATRVPIDINVLD